MLVPGKEVLERAGLDSESKLGLGTKEGEEGRLSRERVDTQESESHAQRVIVLGRDLGKKKVLTVSDSLCRMSCC